MKQQGGCFLGRPQTDRPRSDALVIRFQTLLPQLNLMRVDGVHMVHGVCLCLRFPGCVCFCVRKCRSAWCVWAAAWESWSGRGSGCRLGLDDKSGCFVVVWGPASVRGGSLFSACHTGLEERQIPCQDGPDDIWVIIRGAFVFVTIHSWACYIQESQFFMVTAMVL